MVLRLTEVPCTMPAPPPANRLICRFPEPLQNTVSGRPPWRNTFSRIELNMISPTAQAVVEKPMPVAPIAVCVVEKAFVVTKFLSVFIERKAADVPVADPAAPWEHVTPQ